jgi:hypothetical protein
MAIGERIKDALWAIKNSRKAKIIILIVLLVGVATAAGYVLFAGDATSQRNTNVSEPLANAEPTEQSIRRAIDGVMVPISRANAYPVGVVVENLVASRPQAGLEDANVVFEHLAEGGITRFLAVYASRDTIAKIGPVRSARQVHLDIAKELHFLFAHAGGSPEALKGIKSSGIDDFNQFFNGQYYWRDAERQKTKATEHTLYTSSELLARALRDFDAPLVGDFEPWLFQDDASLSNRPSEPKSMTIDFSSFNYKVEWRYDRAQNVYTRYLAEQPHTMENGKGISAKNVVVQYVPTSLADSAGRLQIDLVGEGVGVLFQNGRAVNVTWKKDTATARTRYYDESNEEVRFVAGTTWVELLPNDREVSYD